MGDDILVSDATCTALARLHAFQAAIVAVYGRLVLFFFLPIHRGPMITVFERFRPSSDSIFHSAFRDHGVDVCGIDKGRIILSITRTVTHIFQSVYKTRSNIFHFMLH